MHIECNMTTFLKSSPNISQLQIVGIISYDDKLTYFLKHSRVVGYKHGYKYNHVLLANVFRCSLIQPLTHIFQLIVYIVDSVERLAIN